MKIIRIIGIALGVIGIAAGIRTAISRRKSRYAARGL